MFEYSTTEKIYVEKYDEEIECDFEFNTEGRYLASTQWDPEERPTVRNWVISASDTDYDVNAEDVDHDTAYEIMEGYLDQIHG